MESMFDDLKHGLWLLFVAGILVGCLFFAVVQWLLEHVSIGLR